MQNERIRYYYLKELDEPQQMMDDLDAYARMMKQIWSPHERNDQRMM
jgi:hypothetical protein